MFNLLVLNAVDCGFEPWSDQTKDQKVGICCFTAKGDNSLKSVERFDHMMFVCRFQASR
jgi:hypothetical protein